MADTVTIAAASGAAGLAGAVIGACSAIYARGRADGRRDEVIEQHAKRLEEGTQKIRRIEERGAETDKGLAVLSEKVDGIVCTTDETREMVRDLVKAVASKGGGR